METADRKHLKRAEIDVEGLYCTSCSTSVEQGFTKLPGVLQASVSLMKSAMQVTFDDRLISVDALIKHLQDMGFDGAVRNMESLEPTKRLRVAIEGMTCSSCSSAVESELASLEGVHHAVVSLTLQEAKIEYDGNLVNEAAILQAIQDAGFEGRSLGSGDTASVCLELEGMSCTSCGSTVEGLLTDLNGVLDVSAQPLTGKVEVKFDPDRTGPRSMISALQEAGYVAALAPEAGTDGSAVREREKRFWWRKFSLSLIFSIPIFILNMILMMIAASKEGLMTDVAGFTLGEVLSFLLATPVQVCVWAS